MPQIKPISDQQLIDVYNLRQSCQPAEDALSQGMDKLQQNLAHEVAADQIRRGGNYRAQIAASDGKVGGMGKFHQPDHLWQQTMQRVSRILMTHQTACALLWLGDYFDRLQALSLLWAACPRDVAA